MELLEEAGAEVDYSDPHIPVLPPMRNFDVEGESVELAPVSVGRYDCVVVVTAHAAFDYDMIAENAPLVVDTRNVYPGTGNKKTQIFKA
jgi:UDP-N-acetyl-D-glucosamine dehydrogenase